MTSQSCFLGFCAIRNFLFQFNFFPSAYVMFFLNSNGDTTIKMNLDIFYKGRTPFLWYKFILEINIRLKEMIGKKPEPPAGIEPTTFPIPVGRSNHLAMGDLYGGSHRTSHLARTLGHS